MVAEADRDFACNGRRVLVSRVVAREDHVVREFRCPPHFRTLVAITFTTRTEDDDDAAAGESPGGSEGALESVGCVRVVDDDVRLSPDDLETPGGRLACLDRRARGLYRHTQRDGCAERRE